RRLDLGRHRLVEAVEQRAGPLRILLAELGRADQVGEEDCGELALLAREGRRGLDRRSAARAEAGVRRKRGATRGTDGGHAAILTQRGAAAASDQEAGFTSEICATPCTSVIQTRK